MNRQSKVTSEIIYIGLIACCAFALAIFTEGCATQGKSIGLGALTGAAGGAAIGGIIDPGKNGEYRTRNVIIGSAVGGVAGIVAGSMIYDGVEGEKKEAFKEGQASVPRATPSMPGLTNAKVEARWVEGKTIGNRFVEGHYEYLITEPARWEQAQ